MAIIEKMNGERYNLADYGFPSLKVNPVDIQYDSENILGRAGRNRVTRYHGVRALQLKMGLRARDVTDCSLLRDELAAILDDAEDFYIYETIGETYKFEFPGQTGYSTAQDAFEWVPMLYKRWRVERINNDGIEWEGLSGRRVIEFETSDLPYAETPFTSLDLESTPIEWDRDMIGWGMGFDWDEDPPKYTHDTNNFSIKNYGNVDINPRYMPLKVKLLGEFDNNVTIKNLSTGDTFTYNRRLSDGQELILDGINYLVDGVSVTGHTNKKLLKIKKGVNNFEITGGIVDSISFEFPFYYL